jgi:hypothetical protein
MEIDNKWLGTISLEKKNLEMIYFEWDFVSLTNLFKYSNDYLFINKLLLIWTKYICHLIYKLDDQITNAMKAINININDRQGLSIVNLK